MIKFSDCPKFSINNSTTSDFRESFHHYSKQLVYSTEIYRFCKHTKR